MASVTSLNDLVASSRTWLEGQIGQTDRLRPMLAVTGAILFLGLLIAAFTWVGDSVSSLRAAQKELANLQQQVKEGAWPERRQQSETLRFQLYERLWTAETAGLAEASLERWLRERIEQLNVRPDSIRIQRGALQAGDAAGALVNTQRMTAKIVMPFEPEALFQILTAVATDEKILVVDRLLVRSGRNPLIEMDVSTFVTLPGNAR